MSETIIDFSSSTSSTVNTWTLAISGNPNRKKWIIENTSSNAIKIGKGDGKGNIGQILVLDAGEYNGEDFIAYTGDIFVQSGTASQTYQALEYVSEFTSGYQIANKISLDASGYEMAEADKEALNRFGQTLSSQIRRYPYIWYNAKYSSQSDSGTPANATNTTVFNLGNKARETIWDFEEVKGGIMNVYDEPSSTDATASTLTGLLDVSTIGTERPLYDLTSSKTIACGEPQATGHFTFAIAQNLADVTSKTLLTSANTGGITITTNASDQVVFGKKGSSTVTFTSTLTDGADQSIIVTWDSFSGQCILYINGRQQVAGDEQTLLINFEQENLTVGALDGLANNIMIFNDFFDWRQARDLYYLQTYQSNLPF